MYLESFVISFVIDLEAPNGCEFCRVVKGVVLEDFETGCACLRFLADTIAVLSDSFLEKYERMEDSRFNLFWPGRDPSPCDI